MSRLSVCPSVWNNCVLTGRIFIKFDIWVFLENLSRKFKFHQDMTRVLYVKTNTHLLPYLAQLFLEWEMFRTNVLEEIKTYVFCPITFVSRIVSFMRQCGKILYSQGSHRWQYGSHCMLDNWGYKHRLRICNTVFPLRQWLHERASMLRYITLPILRVFQFLSLSILILTLFSLSQTFKSCIFNVTITES
jgi:hypothetical protein